jgi:hypothetical protein
VIGEGKEKWSATVAVALALVIPLSHTSSLKPQATHFNCQVLTDAFGTLKAHTNDAPPFIFIFLVLKALLVLVANKIRLKL